MREFTWKHALGIGVVLVLGIVVLGGEDRTRRCGPDVICETPTE